MQTKHTYTLAHRDTLAYSPGQFCNHILFAGTKNYEMPSMIFHLFCIQTLCMSLCVCVWVYMCVRMCVDASAAVSSPSSSSSGPDNDGGRLMLSVSKKLNSLSSRICKCRRVERQTSGWGAWHVEKVIYARCALYLPTCCTHICPT